MLAMAHSSRIPLDKVQFQVSKNAWVTTQTALLRASVNVTLNRVDLIKARADIMNRLSKIAEGTWHLTDFQRSQDSSGLERLTVNAEARIPQDKLTNVFQQAKSVSYPGATYVVTGIDFTPSLADVEPVKAQLRDDLYQMVNAELARLNKAYPAQQYSVNQMAFNEGQVMAPQPKLFQRNMINQMAAESVSAAPPLMQSQELTMTATVQVASNRMVNNAPTAAK